MECDASRVLGTTFPLYFLLFLSLFYYLWEISRPMEILIFIVLPNDMLISGKKRVISSLSAYKLLCIDICISYICTIKLI